MTVSGRDIQYNSGIYAFHTGKAFPFTFAFSLNINLKTWIASFS